MLRPTLYCISDPANGDPIALLQAAARGAVGFFQFRHKDLDPEERLRIGAALGSVPRRTTHLLVSRSWELARAIGADGVHWPSDDFQRIGPTAERKRAIVGVSVHSLEDAVQAAECGVDYLLLAPVFAPLSKSPGRAPLGLAVLRRVCARVAVPVIALGGMRPEDFGSVLEAGAAGIAGISLFGTPNQFEATLESFRRACGGDTG